MTTENELKLQITISQHLFREIVEFKPNNKNPVLEDYFLKFIDNIETNFPQKTKQAKIYQDFFILDKQNELFNSEKEKFFIFNNILLKNNKLPKKCEKDFCIFIEENFFQILKKEDIFQENMFLYLNMIERSKIDNKKQLYKKFINFYTSSNKQLYNLKTENIKKIDSLNKNFCYDLFKEIIYNYHPKNSQNNITFILEQYAAISETFLNKFIIYSSCFIDYMIENKNKNFIEDLMTIFVQGNRKQLIAFNSQFCNRSIVELLSERLPMTDEKTDFLLNHLKKALLNCQRNFSFPQEQSNVKLWLINFVFTNKKEFNDKIFTSVEQKVLFEKIALSMTIENKDNNKHIFKI